MKGKVVPDSFGDYLEPSTISNAQFSAGFLEVILIFKTCQNAPFRALFLDMIKLELHRNYVARLVMLWQC